MSITKIMSTPKNKLINPFRIIFESPFLCIFDPQIELAEGTTYWRST
jgi:hypothetical protein